MRRILFAFAIVLTSLASAPSAFAIPDFAPLILQVYPNATGLVTCGTCHRNFANYGPLNPYGTAFLNADGFGDPIGAMTAIDNGDADGDGTTNGEEMSTGAGFLPGFSCDTADTALNAPSNILDFVDPKDIGCTGGTTTTLPTTTTTTGPTTTTTVGVTTTTLPGEPKCSQPVSTGATPVAGDCLFILRTSVGSSTCSTPCICDPNADSKITASDSLVCLKKAVGQNVTLNCPCNGVTTTTVTVTTTTVSSTTTTLGGGGNIEAGRVLYDAQCSFCHAAGAYDPNAELASDLAGDGDKMVPNLAAIDPSMQITLSDQEVLDMAAFLDSL